ncbi:polyphosphate kinase 2 family protein [Rathayibacter sp. KR2-224]|uniref:polyphosphate kinase 2 family protein n=1 Tax=Rathayibacter sp. KR2-224 TaxID=3400913 RepID=UPI003C05B4FA
MSTGKRKADRSGWIVDPAVQLLAADGFDLSKIPTGGKPGFTGSSKAGKQALRAASEQLADLQERLFAGRQRAVLLVLQGMDTSGKGGIVAHVVGAVNPQGVKYVAFKPPTEAELRHDFLWRIRKQVPEPGIIGVFDRSHYEDVLAGSVRSLAPEDEIERRYGAINDFESELVESGIRILKVMLHLGADEQKSRLLARLDDPEKYWKYNPGDVDDRALWPRYQEAYQRAIERTSTPEAPWYVVPADHKWYARLAVQQLLLGVLEDFDLEWPPADFDVDAERERLLSLSLAPTGTPR